LALGAAVPHVAASALGAAVAPVAASALGAAVAPVAASALGAAVVPVAASVHETIGVLALGGVLGARPALACSPVSAPAAIDARRARGPQLTIPRRTWPNRLGPLVGRDDEVRDVQAALLRSCLVTIVGVAGVGKTRLAQEILAREAEKLDAAVAWIVTSR
jgi:hypothetical protein